MDKEYEAFYQDDFKDDYFDRTKVAKKKEKQEIVYRFFFWIFVELFFFSILIIYKLFII